MPFASLVMLTKVHQSSITVCAHLAGGRAQVHTNLLCCLVFQQLQSSPVLLQHTMKICIAKDTTIVVQLYVYSLSEGMLCAGGCGARKHTSA